MLLVNPLSGNAPSCDLIYYFNKCQMILLNNGKVLPFNGLIKVKVKHDSLSGNAPGCALELARG